MWHVIHNIQGISLLDEMYIKEGLVFDKSTGSLIGFFDMGELNNCFLKYI